METVDLELDRLISKRASQDRRPDPDEESALWKASVAAYNRTCEEERRQAWYEFHQDQAANLRQILEDLISHHEGKARELLAVEGQGEGRT